MQEVVKSVKRVSDLIGEIASATNEQSAGIGQVNTAVTELDRVTQQNAALVEESAAASESLKQQALRLAQSVAVFRLERTVEAAADASALPAPPQARAQALPGPARKVKAARSAPRIAAAGSTPAAATAGEEEWKEF